MDVRSKVQWTYYYYSNPQKIEGGLNWLKNRTLLVKRVDLNFELAQDLNGKFLSDFIEKKFQHNGIRGNV